MGNNNIFFESLFKKNTASPGIKEFLKSIVQDHPYFSPAQFYLLLHTEPGTTEYNKQAAVTTALFNNPYWLQFQLNEALELQEQMPLPGALSLEAADYTQSNKIEGEAIEPQINAAEMAPAVTETHEAVDNKLADFTQHAEEDGLQNEPSTVMVKAGEEMTELESQQGEDALMSEGSFDQENNLPEVDDIRENFAAASNQPDPTREVSTDNENTPSNADGDQEIHFAPSAGQPISAPGEISDQEAQNPVADSSHKSHPAEITDEPQRSAPEMNVEEEQMPIKETELAGITVESIAEPLSPSIDMTVKEEPLPAANSDQAISAIQAPAQPSNEVEKVNNELPGENPRVDESVIDEMPTLPGDETNTNKTGETGELITGQQAGTNAGPGNFSAESNEQDANSSRENKPFNFRLNIDVSDTTEEKISFEPLYTTDYFASQGIKISTDIAPGDKLGKQLKSFTEWLKTMKKVHSEQLTPVNDATDITIQKLAENSNKENEVVTEAMAEVLLQQDKRAKAIEVYQKLSLLNPSKTAYFATKIDQLKEH